MLKEKGGRRHKNHCTFAKGENTFACVAWEGRRGNRRVSEVGRNVLQMWCAVALCQWLVMLQQRQVTCTWTDKPQQCCSCRYCASGEERCHFELMLYRMLPHCRVVCSQTDKHCAVGVTQETFCNRRAPKAYEPRLSDVRYAEDRDCTNTQKERSKVPGCYLLHKQDATFDCTS